MGWGGVAVSPSSRTATGAGCSATPTKTSGQRAHDVGSRAALGDCMTEPKEVGASGAASAQAGAANPWECPVHPGAHYMLHYDGRKYCYYCLVEAVARDCDMPIFADE